MDVPVLVTDVRRNKQHFATLWHRYQESRFTYAGLRDTREPARPARAVAATGRRLLNMPIYSFITTAQGITLQTLRPAITGGADAIEPRPHAVRVRVLAVSAQPLMRRGIMAVLQPEPDIEVLGCCADAQEASMMTGALHPDVLLLDPGLLRDTTAVIRSIKQQCPGTRVLVLSDDPGSNGDRAPAGADTYVSRHIAPTALLDAIRIHPQDDGRLHSAVSRGGWRPAAAAQPAPSEPDATLTQLEAAVLTGVARGLTDREIAATLFLSEAAVKTQLRQLYRRFRLQNRADAAAFAAERGLRDGPRPPQLNRPG